MTYFQTNNYYTNAKKQNGYDSKFEAGYGLELRLRKKAKDIKDYEEQVNLDLIVNDYKVCSYKIDFIIHHNDGTTEYVETKGYPTPVWKLKWRLFEALFSQPGNKLTVVYQGKQKYRPLRKSK